MANWPLIGLEHEIYTRCWIVGRMAHAVDDEDDDGVIMWLCRSLSVAAESESQRHS